MFETYAPLRTECTIPGFMLAKFQDYIPRSKDRTLRQYGVDIVESATPLDNPLDVLNGPSTSGEPSSKRQKLEFDGRVYKNDSNLLYFCILYKVDIALNHNSFYMMKVLIAEKGSKIGLLKQYGRFGCREKAIFKEMPSIQDACSEFEKKFKEQTGNRWGKTTHIRYLSKYALLRIAYHKGEGSKTKQENGSEDLDESIRGLVEQMFNEDNMKTALVELKIISKLTEPLLVISPDSLKQANVILKTIINVIRNGETENDDDFKRNSHQFYHLVPQICGDSQQPIINNEGEIIGKVQLIDSLYRLEFAHRIKNEFKSASECYRNLNTKITLLDLECDEHFTIASCVDTAIITHGDFQIENIFKIERNGDETKFKLNKNDPNRALLFYFPRFTSIASILSQGFDIFGTENGIIFHSAISEENITSDSDGLSLILVCEVALGNINETAENLDLTIGENSLPEGKNSLTSNGNSLSNKCLLIENGLKVPLIAKEEDENAHKFIIYDESRCKTRYLIQVKQSIQLNSDD